MYLLPAVPDAASAILRPVPALSAGASAEGPGPTILANPAF